MFSFSFGTRSVHATIQNTWPGIVRFLENDAGHPDRITAAGPLFERRTSAARTIWAMRPFYVRIDNKDRMDSQRYSLYPFLSFRKHHNSSDFSLLQLIRVGRSTLDGDETTTDVDIWPFVFARTSTDPEISYKAFFPIWGTIRNRFFHEQIDFAAFPFYLKTSNADEVTYSVPWPFIRIRTGPESRGFAFWPLFGTFSKAGAYHHRYALWPLFYDYRDGLDSEKPFRRIGLLPFYASETAPGLSSRTYLWPFFGYTHESHPRLSYRERRYFWPFFVQGRGEGRRVNRWLPFYSDEETGGHRKRWWLWPLLSAQHWTDRGLDVRRQQILYFLFWNESQRPTEQTSAMETARRMHIWPILSYWNDGRGSQQIQLISPLEPFFQWNEAILETYSPLFALYRYDERGSHSQHSLLWNLITRERSPDSTHTQIGPLFEFGQIDGLRYFEILKGLVGFAQKPGGSHWNLFWVNL